MKTFSPTSSTRTSARSSGFTVIEVLVALVILLIGGLAIMNLFPPALNVIKGSENREVAMAQVKGTLARYTNDPASIPDAIYDNTGVKDDVAVEGSRSRNASLPNTLLESDFDLSALGHFKHIVGERHKVISYTDTTGPNPVIRSFVLLNYAYAYTDPMATAGNPVVSTAETVEGARVDTDGKLNFDNAIIASDGGPFTPPLPTTPPTIYLYASYSWQSTVGGPLQSIADELVDLTRVKDPTTGSMDVKVFHTARVVSGPIDMKVFYLKPLPTTLVPPIVVNADMPFRGYLPVDPALKGREVVVDYDVRDWRWLVEDTTATVLTSKLSPVVPQAAINTARDVKLSVPFLGTPQPAPTPPLPVPTPTPDPDLYALAMPAPDASNQIFSNALGGKWTPTVGGNGVVLDVSSASATYNVDDGSGNPMIAPRVRTSYWASKGWAQQLSVAASSYYAYDPARTKVEPWREFYWGPLSDSTLAGKSDNTLYFHASEAGKTIMVSFLNGTNKVANQIVTIGSRIKNAPASVPSGFGSKVAEAILAESNGDPAGAVTALTSVRGVSVRARTAWQQGSDYTQEVAEMYRPLN